MIVRGSITTSSSAKLFVGGGRFRASFRAGLINAATNPLSIVSLSTIADALTSMTRLTRLVAVSVEMPENLTGTTSPLGATIGGSTVRLRDVAPSNWNADSEYIPPIVTTGLEATLIINVAVPSSATTTGGT